MFWNKKKVKEKTMKDFVFSIKKITTFDGTVWYYPLYKEDGLVPTWNVIFEVNGRTLTYLPNYNVDKDPTYACKTLVEAERFIEGYRQVLISKLDAEIQKEETIEYSLEKLNTEYENQEQ
jgi:hypothetical protein